MVMPNVNWKPPQSSQEPPQKTIQSFWAGMSSVAKTWIIAGAAAVLLLIIIIVAAGGSGPSGYNNINTLQNGPTSASTWGAGADVPVSAICVHNGGTQFTCELTYSDSSQGSVP